MLYFLLIILRKVIKIKVLKKQEKFSVKETFDNLYYLSNVGKMQNKTKI